MAMSIACDDGISECGVIRKSNQVKPTKSREEYSYIVLVSPNLGMSTSRVDRIEIIA